MATLVDLEFSIFSVRNSLLVLPSAIRGVRDMVKIEAADTETVRSLSSHDLSGPPPQITRLAEAGRFPDVAPADPERPKPIGPGDIALMSVIPARVSVFSCEADAILARTFRGLEFWATGRQGALLFTCDLGNHVRGRVEILDFRRPHDRAVLSCSGVPAEPSEARKAWFGEEHLALAS